MTFKSLFSTGDRRLRALALVACLTVAVTLSLGAWGGKKKGKLISELPTDEQATEQAAPEKSPAQKAREARAEKAAAEKAKKAEKQAAKQAEKDARRNASKAANQAPPEPTPTPPPVEAKPKAPEPKPQTPPPPKKKSILDWFTSSKSTYDEVEDALKEAEKDLSKKKYVDAMTLAAKTVSKIREQELDRNGSDSATAEQFQEAIKRAESIAQKAGANVENNKVPYYKATYVEL